jgi:hypothetical protein
MIGMIVLSADKRMIASHAAQPSSVTSLRLYVSAAADYDAVSYCHDSHSTIEHADFNGGLCLTSCKVSERASQAKTLRVHVNVDLTSFVSTVWGLHGSALHGLPQRGDG